MHAVCPSRSQSPRHGAALFIVLVVLVMLTLAAYTFTSTMVGERQATEMYARDVQSRLLAESGIEYVAALLESPDELTQQNYYHDPDMFGAITVLDGGSERSRGRFSIVAPVENDAGYLAFRYGLIDEAGKLNINAISTFGLEPEVEREFLMYLPGMDESLADAILDWIDEDDEPREFGAESDVYDSMSPPYVARNGPCESIDELLRVSGMTYALLYGEDTNRNGLLDPNENDGDLSLPYDTADGVLDLGLSGYLTVYSQESNLRSDGSDKIDINQSLLTELFDELELEFGEEVAQFIVAYRMNGANNVEQLEGQGQVSTGDDTTDRALQQFAQALVKSAMSAGTSGSEVTRGGMDLSAGGNIKFVSLYDMIDAEVTANIDGTSTTLVSPWTSDPGSLQESLPMLFDTLTTTSSSTIKGRININQARPEVLLGLPEMPPELASAISSSMLIGPDGAPLTDLIAQRQTTGWLLIEGLTDLTTLRLLDPYITAHGSVYRVQSIGHYGSGGPATRLEAIVDATQFPARIVSLRDLSGLGTGYPVIQQVGNTAR